MGFIEQLGQQTAGNAVNAGMGLILGGINDKRQLKQQGKLQELQIKGSKELTDYQKMKELQMWKDTSYGPQMEMMKEAGLNPALMYGMSGGGGTTTGGGTAMPSGGNAPTGGREAVDIMGMGLMQAQKGLIEAQTEKTKAEATKTAGVDTSEANTRIASLTQGIENAKAQEAMNKVETRLKQIEESVQGATASERIEQIEWMSLRALEELDIIQREAFISKATMNDKIDLVKREAIGAMLKNLLTKAQTDNTKQGTEKIKSDIKVNESTIKTRVQELMQGWDKLSQGDRQIELQKIMTEYGTEINPWIKAGMGVLEQAVDGIMRKK